MVLSITHYMYGLNTEIRRTKPMNVMYNFNFTCVIFVLPRTYLCAYICKSHLVYHDQIKWKLKPFSLWWGFSPLYFLFLYIIIFFLYEAPIYPWRRIDFETILWVLNVYWLYKAKRLEVKDEQIALKRRNSYWKQRCQQL